MPRHARLDIPGALHHVMVRGINKTAIFRDIRDRARFLERLGTNVVGDGCSVCAWVLMDNHIHLLIRSGPQGLSSMMRKLLTWYAQYFNRRHGRSGHLFENRYKSILCDEDAYLAALVRYIHLNPVRAKVVNGLTELDRYPWSGHRTIMGQANYPWMDVDCVLSQFGRREKTARTAYRRFVEEGMSLGRQPGLTGGGLIRSLGGWSNVVSMRRKIRKEETDERILGSGDFVRRVLGEAEERALRQLKIKKSGLGIATIIDEECSKARISRAELKAGSRRARVSRARAVVARRGMAELGLPAAELARCLGVNTSSITRAVARLEKERS
ncbi:MAG: transposase [Nitrospirae bacterium]|nr:transposase [Nitrospirota bacterium]